MGHQIKAQTEDGGTSPVLIDTYPDSCPVCHHKVQPVFRLAYHDYQRVQIVFLCPNAKCKSLFISYYTEDPFMAGRIETTYAFRRSQPWKLVSADFSDEIKTISEMFVKIYNEAREAEHQGLLEICGAGYRKALEFLVKDYLIKEQNIDPDLVRDTLLGKCIDIYVDDGKLKSCAKRAAWLGNDQTHYYKKWKDKDLENLKTLLALTVNWVRSECLTKKMMADMPEGKIPTK